MELDKNQHSVYSINYHLIMVVKYRKKDNLHKLTAKLVKEYDVIVVENLSVKNMMKNHIYQLQSLMLLGIL